MRRKDTKRAGTSAKRSGAKRRENTSVSIHFESSPPRNAGAAAPAAATS